MATLTTSVVAILATLSALVGITVLLANPRRFPNQAFALLSLMATLWLLLVAGTAVANDPIPWTRANAIVSTFAPWSLAILSTSIARKGLTRAQIVWRTFPWCAMAIIATPLCLSATFVWQPDPSSAYERGDAYTIHSIIIIISYILVVVDAAAHNKFHTGIRSIEMQFLVLNMAVGALTCLSLVLIGNYVRSVPIKLSGVIALGGSYALAAWGITSQRIFNLRHVFTSIAQRLITGVSIGACGITIGRYVGSYVDDLLTIVIACGVSTILGFSVDKKLRQILDIDGDRELTTARNNVFTLARTESTTDRLISKLEALLSGLSGTDTAILMFECGAAFRGGNLALSKERIAFAAFLERGWATRESLQRRTLVPSTYDLVTFLAEHSIGLLLAVPPGSQTPSMLVAFGMKLNQYPFTFPEIRRAQNITELMDNILTHSRLTSHAALNAKAEHLAMMSRGLAHDLKNLLTPVSSFLIHAEGRLAPNSPEAEVHVAAQRSMDIIQEYVREAGFFAERLAPYFDLISVPHVLERVRDATANRAQNRDITIVTHAPPQLRFIADAVLIQRLLANLVLNAIDASRPGSLIAIRAELAAERIRLTVKDSGCGIPQEHLDKIFDAYFTTKQFGSHVRGFGLGLTICQKIAALHEGTISVESEVGRGTTFLVDLPASPVDGRNPSLDSSVGTFPPSSEITQSYPA